MRDIKMKKHSVLGAFSFCTTTHLFSYRLIKIKTTKFTKPILCYHETSESYYRF